MAEAHPNLARTQAAIKAYQAGNFDDMRQYLADDIVWHVGGHHQLSGDYRGVDAVLDYYSRAQELSGGSLAIEPVEIMADDRFGAAIMRATGERAGKRLDATLAEGLKFDEQGRWAEYWALANDQRAVDEFWGKGE